MKKLILPLLVAGAFVAPSMAQAASNPYVSLSNGLSLMNNSTVNSVSNAITYKTGYFINGAVGLRQGDARFEAEIGYHRNTVNGTVLTPVNTSAYTSASMWTFMANAYYDFDIKASGVTPFVMGGLGLADVNMKTIASNETTKFAWQLGAGVGVKVAKDINIDLGYRYLKPSAPSVNGQKITLGASELLVGVRYDF
jgi:opacity protein-like surface antigen